MISAICCTYGQYVLTCEALESFRRQDYTGQRELILLNSCTHQKFFGDFPNIKIINLAKRPSSLGVCRNLAIEAASGDIICLLDCDDLMLPNHLSILAAQFDADPDISWVVPKQQFYAEGDALRITPSTCTQFAFRKAAWKAVGGYPDLTVGEDQKLIGAISAQFKGVKYDGDPTFIYRWGLGNYHASGLGFDKSGQVPAYERVRQDFMQRVGARREPVGNITLKPHWRRDYVADAQKCLDNGRISEAIASQGVCVVELGRIGDIINILPVCHHICHRMDSKPYLMVSREFADLLQGVSYVEPYPVPLKPEQLREAVEMAKHRFAHVIRTQIWGKDHNQPRLTQSYNMESWREAGFLPHFHDPEWPLVFDRRDEKREALLVEKLVRGDKPLMVVNVTRGISSKWDGGKALLERLQAKWGDHYQILDVADMVLTHFFDMLALIEKAAVVVSMDTSLLHLAQATKTPVIALVNPAPWLGTVTRFPVALRLNYNEVTESMPKIDVILANEIYERR